MSKQEKERSVAAWDAFGYGCEHPVITFEDEVRFERWFKRAELPGLSDKALDRLFAK